MATAVEALVDELRKVIQHFRVEWHLTYCEAIGCLELIKHDLVQELIDDDELDEESSE